MSPDLIPDLLDGLVAGGTLALAGATVYLGRESARVAVDTGTPRVFLSQLQVPEQPFTPAVVAGGEPQEVKPGLIWSLAQHGRDKLGLEANFRLTNESTMTALVRLDTPPDTEIMSVHVLPTDRYLVEVPLQGDWHVIGPGAQAACSMIWWKPASEWADLWTRGTPDSPPLTTVTVNVRGSSGEAYDSCKVSFGSYVVVPHPREDGWVIGIRDVPWLKVPGTIPGPATDIGLMQRSYHRRLLRRRR